MLHTRSIVLSLVTICALLAVVQASQASGGQFVGRLVTEWLDDGRNMRLINEFAYKSPDRLEWKVPKGTVVNGASIPRFLWSFIGSPFGDRYRKASVIHDYYCESRTRPAERVHKVFYEAMLDAGVDPAKAWIMYQAVYRFGPTWKVASRCRRINGRIDFNSCTRNAAPTKPKVVRRRASPNDIKNFINEMKNSKYSKAARELENAIGKWSGSD